MASVSSTPTSATPDVEQEQQHPPPPPAKSGELLICGCTSWENIGRKTCNIDATSTLLAPTRLRQLMDVNISFVVSGSVSCHCVAIDVDGRCFTWGRNEKGQLGHGDLLNRDKPTVVEALSRHKIINAGAGRSHTIVVTSSGDSLAFGCNKHGQLGSGSLKNELEFLPVKCLASQVTHTACGADFSVWLSSTPNASILTAGLPQYGQLGHGTNNEYNAKQASVKMVYEPQPRPRSISAFAGKTITKVACGNNHTVAADSNGFVYTWGFGGHGRLGHKEQKDEWSPRMLEIFQRNNTLPPSAIVAAGSAYSACTAAGSQLYMWGRVKSTGDSWMYPKPVYDLSNWAIRCMDCGDKTSIVGADDSCISWGMSVYGELGYGSSGPKSSANPRKIDLLEGMHVISVACGAAHTLIVVDRTNVGDRLDKLDVYEGREIVLASEEPQPEKANPFHKRKAEDTEAKYENAADDEAAVSGKIQNGEKKSKGRPKKLKEEKKPRGRPPAEVESSEHSESDDEGDSDDEKKTSRKGNGPGRGRGRGRGRGQGQGRGRGRGRGRGKTAGASEPSETETKSSKASSKRGRGRGRGRASRS